MTRERYQRGPHVSLGAAASDGFVLAGRLRLIVFSIETVALRGVFAW